MQDLYNTQGPFSPRQPLPEPGVKHDYINIPGSGLDPDRWCCPPGVPAWVFPLGQGGRSASSCLQGARSHVGSESPARARISPGNELCPRCPQARSNPTSKEQSFLSGSPSLPQDLRASPPENRHLPATSGLKSFQGYNPLPCFLRPQVWSGECRAGPSSPSPSHLLYWQHWGVPDGDLRQIPVKFLPYLLPELSLLRSPGC